MRLAELFVLTESEAQKTLMVQRYTKQIMDKWGGQATYDKFTAEMDAAFMNDGDDPDEPFEAAHRVIERFNNWLQIAYEECDSMHELPKVEDLVHLIYMVLETTTRRKYLEWVIKQYIKDWRVLEDMDAINPDIDAFERLKPRIPSADRDINKYDRRELQRYVYAHAGTKSNNELKKAEVEAFKSQINKIYEGHLGRCYVPTTVESSCFLGRGTRWCTAANDSSNYFNRYNDHGSLYVFILPNGDKYQYWCPDWEREFPKWDDILLMDAQDHEVHNPKAVPGLLSLMAQAALRNSDTANDFYAYFIPYLGEWINEETMANIWKTLGHHSQEWIKGIVLKDIKAVVAWEDHFDLYKRHMIQKSHDLFEYMRIV